MTPEVKERIEQIRHGNVPEGYKKTAAGIMPIIWRQVRIGDVCAVNPLRPKKQEERVTFLGMADVSEEGRLINPNIVDYTKVSKGFTPFERGDILVAKITPCFENGKGADTNALPTQQGYGSTEFHVLRCKDVDRRYMFLHTTSYEFRKKLESEMTGSAGQKRVQTESVASYLLGLPSADEQQRIAEILTVQDKAIELKEKLMAEKQRQKKYLMQQLLTGKKRLPGFSDKWKFAELGKISKKRKEKNKKFEYSLVFSNSAQHGIIPQTEQFDKEIANEERIDGYYIVHDSFFVYNPRISVTAPCGPINRNETGKTGVMSPLYTVFSIESEEINQDFLKQYFKSSCWYRHMKSVANYGARHDRMNVSDEDFFLMPIPIPCMDEQRAIAGILSAADKEIELLRQDLEQEKQKKKAMMQLLLTGIVRV